MVRPPTAGLALLICASLLLGGVAVADSAYQITIPGGVDTPDRNVTLEGEEYTISAIGVVTPGESIVADISAPDDSDYNVYLFDNNRHTIDADSMSGDGTYRFDTTGYEAGSYMLAVYGPEDNFRAIHPIVIVSYEVTIDAPDTAETGETVQITVTVENVSGTTKQLNYVQVVLSNESDQALRATKSGDGTYSVETTLSEPGEYLVYANVRGYEDANGHTELIGAGNTNPIEVHDPTPTATSTATDEGNSNTQSSGTQTPTETPISTGSTSQTASPTATATSTVTATPTATPVPTTTTPTATSDAVLTPSTEESTTQTTAPIHPVVPLVALGTFLLWRRS